MPTVRSLRPSATPQPRRATNLTPRADVPDAAGKPGLNVSRVCDAHLREVVRVEQARRWREEHADFIAAYDTTLAAQGLPLGGWNGF